MTTTDTLIAAGWTIQPNGKWRSPHTNHDYDEKVARLLAGVPTLTTASQLVRRTPRQYLKR